MTESFDLAVVGGGPAGSNTARVAKEQNPDLDVVLFERGEEPAANCAGGLGAPFWKHVGYRPPEEVIERPVRNIYISSPNDEWEWHMDELNEFNPEWADEELNELGWILDRQAWDNYQLKLAEEAGVDVRTEHTVALVDQSSSNSCVQLDVLNRKENVEIEIESDYAALANGPNWGLAVDAGFNEADVVPSRKHLHMGLQYHMKDPGFLDEYGRECIYLHFDRRYAPDGYTWSFPESEGYTRWGNAVPLDNDRNASECLNQFFEDTEKTQLVNSSRQKTNALIPTCRPLDSCINNNVALVGDAGHHCDPLHGGGMLIGARAGMCLGQAVADDDFAQYDQMWKDEVLSTLQHRFMIRDVIVSLDNGGYDRLVNALQGFEFNTIDGDKEIPRLVWHAIKNDRGIFTKSAIQATKSYITQKGLSL